MSTSPRHYLVNSVFSVALGHVIEGIAIGNAIRRTDPDAKISILVNKQSALSLFACVAHLDFTVVRIDVSRTSPILGILDIDRLLPGPWSFAITIHDERGVTWQAPHLSQFHCAFKAWTISRSLNSWRLYDGPARFPDGTALKYSPVRFQIPALDRRFACEFLKSASFPRIALLLGSGLAEKTPSIRFWRQLAVEVRKTFPENSVILIGKTGNSPGSTANLTPEGIEFLKSDSRNILSAVDVPITAQLAIAEQCSVLVGPHSGMAFAIQCTGLPWVVLSGWSYHEYFTNGVPIISILPKCPKYPCDGTSILSACTMAIQDKRTVECLSDTALIEQIDNVLAAIRSIYVSKISYRECVADYKFKITQFPGGPRHLWENAE